MFISVLRIVRTAFVCASDYDDRTQFYVFEQKSNLYKKLLSKNSWTFVFHPARKTWKQKFIYLFIAPPNRKHCGTAQERWMKLYPTLSAFDVKMPPWLLRSRGTSSRPHGRTWLAVNHAFAGKPDTFCRVAIICTCVIDVWWERPAASHLTIDLNTRAVASQIHWWQLHVCDWQAAGITGW